MNITQEMNNEQRISTQMDDIPILSIHSSDNTEILKFEQNGDILLKGKKITKDMEVVDGFKEFLKSQGIQCGDTTFSKIQTLVKQEHNDQILGSKIRNILK